MEDQFVGIWKSTKHTIEKVFIGDRIIQIDNGEYDTLSAFSCDDKARQEIIIYIFMINNLRNGRASSSGRA
jgi:hypothetical protein